MTEFQCLEDRVLVLPIKKTESETSEAGLILDMKVRDTMEGEVVAVGQGYTARDTGVFVPTVLHKKDIVLIGKNTGTPIDVPDETGKQIEHLLLRESDVLCLIKKSS